MTEKPTKPLTSNNMHEGLSDSNLRDFLSVKLKECHRRGGSAVAGWLERQEAALKSMQDEVQASKDAIALDTVMRMKGWDDLNTESFIPYDALTYRDFIGTEEELEQLEKKHKK